MTRPLFIIEDPVDADAVDRLTRPKVVDEHAERLAEEPPFGEGTYLSTCVECGFRFYTEDRYAEICRPCDAEDAARLTRGWHRYAYPYRKFRGGRRD